MIQMQELSIAGPWVKSYGSLLLGLGAPLHMRFHSNLEKGERGNHNLAF